MCRIPKGPPKCNFREIKLSDEGFRIYWTILNDGNSLHKSTDILHTNRPPDLHEEALGVGRGRSWSPYSELKIDICNFCSFDQKPWNGTWIKWGNNNIFTYVNYHFEGQTHSKWVKQTIWLFLKIHFTCSRYL